MAHRTIVENKTKQNKSPFGFSFNNLKGQMDQAFHIPHFFLFFFVVERRSCFQKQSPLLILPSRKSGAELEMLLTLAGLTFSSSLGFRILGFFSFPFFCFQLRNINQLSRGPKDI
jgi:hypothetical protein